MRCKKLSLSCQDQAQEHECLGTPKVLYLKSDKQRVRANREGQPGTGMFPDTTMTTQEPVGLARAYLAHRRT